MSDPVAKATAWHRVPLMWLVVALPLLAFIGGAVMVALTVLRPDVEIHSERLEASGAAPVPRHGT